MRGNKCRLFHVCVYQPGLVALTAEVSRPMCPPAAAVRLVPLAHGVPLLVFPAPPRSQRPPCLLLAIGPIGPNLKNQYSCEEQMMQLQLSINIESHRQFTYLVVLVLAHRRV